jgi:hypothetical protein
VARLDLLQAAAQRDPLGTQQRAITELQPRIEALEARLAASVDKRTRVAIDLATTGRVLDEIRIEEYLMRSRSICAALGRLPIRSELPTPPTTPELADCLSG